MFDSTMHRKIRLYVELGDDIDNTGHGTHTMGSLLGSPYEISNVKALDYRWPCHTVPHAFKHLVCCDCRLPTSISSLTLLDSLLEVAPAPLHRTGDKCPIVSTC